MLLDNIKKRWEQCRKHYRQLNGREKTTRLDELQRLTGSHRKYLIFLLSRRRSVEPVKKGKRKRRPHTSEAAIKVLFKIWRLSGRLSSARLRVQLSRLLQHADKPIADCTPAVKRQLLSISARQMDRRLAPYKKQQGGSPQTATASRARQHSQHIPVSVSRHGDSPVGLLEADSVEHSGSNHRGTFIRTVNITDAHTGWTAMPPVLGKAAIHVVPVLIELLFNPPFPAWEIHGDNGCEFINTHLARYCQEHDIALTRSRPYHKNDSPSIEQKNFTRVRQIPSIADTTSRRSCDS